MAALIGFRMIEKYDMEPDRTGIIVYMRGDLPTRHHLILFASH